VTSQADHLSRQVWDEIPYEITLIKKFSYQERIKGLLLEKFHPDWG